MEEFHGDPFSRGAITKKFFFGLLRSEDSAGSSYSRAYSQKPTQGCLKGQLSFLW